MAKVIIYKANNFEGSGKQLVVGDHDVDSLQNGIGQLRSPQIPNGLVITLFAYAGFQAATETFTENAVHIGDDFNDIAS